MNTANSAAHDLSLDSVRQRIISLVTAFPGLQIRDIFAKLCLRGAAQDDFFMMLVENEIYVDIEHEAISPNNTARVYLNETIAKADEVIRSTAAIRKTGAAPTVEIRPGTKLEIDGKESIIVSVSRGVVSLLNGDEHTETTAEELERRIVNATSLAASNPVAAATPNEDGRERLSKLNTAQWAQILESYERIRPYIEAQSREEFVALPKRTKTQRRYLASWRTAESMFGCGLIGLLHKVTAGNRKAKMDPRVRDIITRTIGEQYCSTTAPSVELVWGICIDECNNHVPRLHPPSRPTITAAIKCLDPAKVMQKRFGRRMAYSLTAAWCEEDDILSIDGEHAWSLAHIDHTQEDIETPETADGLFLGRPWLTLLVTPRHRRILAMALSFEPPSYRSCMAVIRDCVRRHRRLPRMIVVDGGKEFESSYFEQLLALFEIGKKVRPPATPRFGAVLERLNCTVNSKLLHNMPGHTRITKTVRVMMKEYDPKRLAVYTLSELWQIVEAFIFEYLDTLPDANTGISPRRAFEDDFERGGPRNHRIILPNERFHILTMPTTKKTTARVCRRSGVTVNKFPYYCAQFRSHTLTGLELPVRYDPDDLGAVYVEIDGEWVKCESKRFKYLFTGLSEFEKRGITQTMLASTGSPKQKRRYSNAASLAVFMRTHGVTPEVRRIQARASENRVAAKPAQIVESEVNIHKIANASPATVDIAASQLEETANAVPRNYVSTRKPKSFPIGFTISANSIPS